MWTETRRLTSAGRQIKVTNSHTNDTLSDNGCVSVKVLLTSLPRSAQLTDIRGSRPAAGSDKHGPRASHTALTHSCCLLPFCQVSLTIKLNFRLSMDTTGGRSWSWTTATTSIRQRAAVLGSHSARSGRDDPRHRRRTETDWQVIYTPELPTLPLNNQPLLEKKCNNTFLRSALTKDFFPFLPQKKTC